MSETDEQIEEIVREAFAAGQEQMRNRAAIAALEIMRSQGAYMNPINLMGNVGRAICDLDIKAFPARHGPE